MMRTQIYISEQTHQKAKQLAEQEATTLASLFREFIEDGLKKKSQKKQGFTALIELGLSGGPADLSEHMDDYLYGNK